MLTVACFGHYGGTTGTLKRGTWDAATLPWPTDGQSSVAVDGVGRIGAKGGQRPVPIASVTKVMTAYVVLRDHPLRGDEQGPSIEVDQVAADEALSASESTVRVRQGQRFTQRQLLELMLIPSGNNIARLLARWDADTQKVFVSKMNDAATALGMEHTTYTGASGIEASTVSTSDDQLKLARTVMKDRVLREIVAKPSTTVPGLPGPIVNTNKLLRKPGVVGLKTGSSTPAGGNLMWAATANVGGRERLVLGVVLHQRAGTSAQQGLEAVLERSAKLIDGVRSALLRDAPTAQLA
ncbi:D-alanyl-D-alanine carboxypeptidase [Streptomyces sp. T1317-0309]|nr:D-alanyl-D-alanine carboxypeptidase [Streptomyces sp. T1317-0309]